MSVLRFVGTCHDIVQFGAVLFLQSGLVLLLGLLSAALVRRRGPFVQSLALRATLIAVASTISVSLLLTPYAHPLWRISLPSEPAHESALAPPMPDAAAPAQSELGGPQLSKVPTPDMISPTSAAQDPFRLPDRASTKLPQKAPDAQPTPPQHTSWLYPTLALVWGIGTLGLFAWGMIGQVALLALRRKSLPCTTGTAIDILHVLCPEWPLPLRVSPAISGPFLGGFWRPTIFLPVSYHTDFDGPMLQAILAHELAHRDRYDNRWMLMTRLLCAVLWFQPLCWVLVRLMEQASEESCDAAALQFGCSRRSYADCLFSLAERMTPNPLERAMGSGSTPLRSQVGRRIENILHRRGSSMSKISGRMTVLVTLSLAAATICGTLFISAGAAPMKTSKHAVSPQPIPRVLQEDDGMRLLAGLTAVQGPGVIVTLNDSHKKLHKTPRAAVLSFLIHDTDINQVINELKAAGAEAIAVNGERLIATSPIRCAGPTVLVNNVPQAPPFLIRAIGNPVVLQMVLNLRGGVKDELSQLDPAMIQIKTMPHLVLPAYMGPTQERYARPVVASEMNQGAESNGPLLSTSITDRKALSDFTTMRDNTRGKLAIRQASLAAYNQHLEDALHQAFPNAEQRTFERALALEREISHYTLGLEIIQYDKVHWKSHQTPKRQKDDRLFIMEREKQLRPMLAEEKQLIPGADAVQQRLMHIHTLAAQCRVREIEILSLQMELQMLESTISKLRKQTGYSAVSTS